MTTNPSTQEAAAMARIRSHINRSAGQHLRAVRQGATVVSEGTESARRILNPNRTSLTPEPLLLHRVDASQLADDRAVHVAGAVEQRRQCRPGLCEGLSTCNDHACQGHQESEVPEGERDGRAFLRFWAGYLLVLAVSVAGAAWLATH